MSIDSMYLWHKRARPEPTEKDFNVQLGCHFEEIAEMCDTLCFKTDIDTAVKYGLIFEGMRELATMLKSGALPCRTNDRKALLDSLADQIVTATGVGHCAKMSIANACIEVDASNWSKFDDNGKPIFDANGKIKKGPNYREPDLTGMY